ncbi:MAG TPA: cytochrome ubiquinol oxidase subunit I [Solirubrobacteraceae bacterium]|nr:cytochrome ubiquinol oxidase subunit I [Solirubrobacteraceae bacterium]
MIAASSSNLLAAREQMAFTLAFHIPFACMGIAFPLMVLIANWLGVRGDADALRLARRWSKVMAVTFAVGAVTGTVLSFELGLLWPGMFSRYGAVFGIPFGIEGLFFFTEAIFIAIYIYGWKRLPPRLHLLSAVPIVIAGIGGAFSVVAANSWMNQPGGFTVGANGKITSVNTWDVLFNNATPYEVPHMLLAAYIVAGFLASSVYAVGWLRGRRDRIHRLGFTIPFVVAAIATPIQLFVGDTAARAIAKDQPTKFAAMEYVQDTSTHVPEWILGFYNGGHPKGGISIPGLDSFLVGFSTGTKVTGFNSVPTSDQPGPKTLLHWSFDVMVFIGTGFLLLAIWWLFVLWRRRALPKSPWFWRCCSVTGVLAVVALWCGWIVTEVGRQPWIVYGKLRTADAVTRSGGIWITFAVLFAIYVGLFIGTVVLLRALARRWRMGDDVDDVPYAPPASESAR